jgi:hypothetical protein
MLRDLNYKYSNAEILFVFIELIDNSRTRLRKETLKKRSFTWNKDKGNSR